MYIKIINGNPVEYSFGHLRRDNPNVSYPREVSDEWLAGHGILPAVHGPKPTPNRGEQVVKGPYQEINGVWTQTYVTQALIPTVERVFEEMEHRLRTGTTINVSGVGPITVKGDDVSIRNLQSLALGASIRINSGQGAVKSKFRDATGVVNQLTQNQIVELWSAGAAYGELLYDKAWALIADPANIPADYTSDVHWQ